MPARADSRTHARIAYVHHASERASDAPVGERFTFNTGAGGEVTGYSVSGARFVRKPTLYISVERRGQPQTPDISVERRKQPQVRYIGVERRAGGEDRPFSVPARRCTKGLIR